MSFKISQKWLKDEGMTRSYICWFENIFNWQSKVDYKIVIKAAEIDGKFDFISWLLKRKEEIENIGA
jgi:hypothetical protein